MEFFVIFWKNLEKIGILWKYLEYFVEIWNILEKFGIPWNILEKFGIFFRMVLYGDNNSSVEVLLNKQEAFFEPGRIYYFMTSVREDLGHVKFADLKWEYASHPLNPLTWRLNSKSQMFVNRVEIETLGHGKKHTFCAQDEPFEDGQPKRVEWKPNCRENAPDPGHSFLGMVLNADPIGNAKFVINQVNPLTANPLNGLGFIGNSVSSFTNSVQQMRDNMRRRFGA